MFLKCILSAHRCQHKLCVDATFWCCANVSLFFVPPRFLLKAVNAEDRQSIVWKLCYEPWLPRAATYCPTPPPSPLPPLTPHCDELTPSAGPECTSNTGPKISGVGADLSFNLLFFKHLDTRLHSSVTRKNYTWQVCLRAWENVYMRAGARQKRWHQCKSSKCLLIFLLPI